MGWLDPNKFENDQWPKANIFGERRDMGALGRGVQAVGQFLQPMASGWAQQPPAARVKDDVVAPSGSARRVQTTAIDPRTHAANEIGAPQQKPYTLDDFIKGTRGVSYQNLAKMMQVMPAQPKPASSKDLIGRELYNMVTGRLQQRLAGAKTDAERLQAYDLATQDLTGLYTNQLPIMPPLLEE